MADHKPNPRPTDDVETTKDDAAAPSNEDKGLSGPFPGDGTNMGETTPEYAKTWGVTPLPETDDTVPAFIPDQVGPRTAAEVKAPTLADRTDEAARRADSAKADNSAATRAVDTKKK